MAKLTIELRPSERKALQSIAYDERRKIQDQAAHFVRVELALRGVLVTAQPIEVGSAGGQYERQP